MAWNQNDRASNDISNSWQENASLFSTVLIHSRPYMVDSSMDGARLVMLMVWLVHPRSLNSAAISGQKLTASAVLNIVCYSCFLCVLCPLCYLCRYCERGKTWLITLEARSRHRCTDLTFLCILEHTFWLFMHRNSRLYHIIAIIKTTKSVLTDIRFLPLFVVVDRSSVVPKVLIEDWIEGGVVFDVEPGVVELVAVSGTVPKSSCNAQELPSVARVHETSKSMVPLG